MALINVFEQRQTLMSIRQQNSRRFGRKKFDLNIKDIGHDYDGIPQSFSKRVWSLSK